jgi:hypothetical protein
MQLRESRLAIASEHLKSLSVELELVGPVFAFRKLLRREGSPSFR